MSSLNCSNDDKIVCKTCGLDLDKKYLGKRCPRCNAVVMPPSCENCKSNCK